MDLKRVAAIIRDGEVPGVNSPEEKARQILDELSSRPLFVKHVDLGRTIHVYVGWDGSKEQLELAVMDGINIERSFKDLGYLSVSLPLDFASVHQDPILPPR